MFLYYCGKRNFNSFSQVDLENIAIHDEELWTYVFALIALKNPKVYESLTGFQYSNSHNIFLEAQPQVPYIEYEGNTHLDMALGDIINRNSNNAATKSGIELNLDSKNETKQVCFLETKFLSDIDTKTTNYVIRNQMERIIDNLLHFNDGTNNIDFEPTFTLLTPRIFKETIGSRLYYYKFHEYDNAKNHNVNPIDMFVLKDAKKRKVFDSDIYQKNFKSLKMRWVTFEEILTIAFSDISIDDVTNLNSTDELWRKLLEEIKKEAE